jgi:glycosyltransferase involved in cell wall biosynthesis
MGSPAISGLVVTYNEEKHLRECLSSLSFCDELLVMDLGSTDGSVAIAEELGATVIHHEWVPIVEQVRGELVRMARHDWVVFLDPDEVFPVTAIDKIREHIAADDTLGRIQVPWQFYFAGKPLTSTQWGIGDRTKGNVFHRDRVNITEFVHKGIRSKDSFKEIVLPRTSLDDCITHYWVDSYADLYKKHRRYLKQEGRSRYWKGERFTWRRWAKKTLQELKNNLFALNGLRDGLRGIVLSVWRTCYVCLGMLDLCRYQKSVEREDSPSISEHET